MFKVSATHNAICFADSADLNDRVLIKSDNNGAIKALRIALETASKAGSSMSAARNIAADIIEAFNS